MNKDQVEHNPARLRPSTGRLCNQSLRRRGVVAPGGRELLGAAVVPGQPVDPRLDQDEVVLGIVIATGGLHVLLHGHWRGKTLHKRYGHTLPGQETTSHTSTDPPS